MDQWDDLSAETGRVGLGSDGKLENTSLENASEHDCNR